MNYPNLQSTQRYISHRDAFLVPELPASMDNVVEGNVSEVLNQMFLILNLVLQVNVIWISLKEGRTVGFPSS